MDDRVEALKEELERKNKLLRAIKEKAKAFSDAPLHELIKPLREIYYAVSKELGE